MFTNKILIICLNLSKAYDVYLAIVSQILFQSGLSTGRDCLFGHLSQTNFILNNVHHVERFKKKKESKTQFDSAFMLAYTQ